MDEEWRDIEGWEGYYQVSNLGNVKSLPRRVLRKNGSTYPVKGGVMSPNKPDGGVYASLVRDSKTHNLSVAYLVADAFLPPRKEGERLYHRNDDVHDCRVENLFWSPLVVSLKLSVGSRGNRTKIVQTIPATL